MMIIAPNNQVVLGASNLTMLYFFFKDMTKGYF